MTTRGFRTHLRCRQYPYTILTLAKNAVILLFSTLQHAAHRGWNGLWFDRLKAEGAGAQSALIVYTVAYLWYKANNDCFAEQRPIHWLLATRSQRSERGIGPVSRINLDLYAALKRYLSWNSPEQLTDRELNLSSESQLFSTVTIMPARIYHITCNIVGEHRIRNVHEAPSYKKCPASVTGSVVIKRAVGDPRGFS